MTRHRQTLSQRRLCCEQLEARCVLSAIAGGDDFHAVIVAGDPNGTPADSPANRVDPNVGDSPFAGVGSLRINTRRGAYICTATAIDTTHVLTAGHCVDINNDGRSDKKDGITSIYFQLNLDTDGPTDQIDVSIKASSWKPHPDFTGFNRPSVNDDLAVITLGQPLPPTVPIYALASTDMSAGQTHLYMVGYGQSGDGVSGYTLGASWTVKRTGENMVDAFYGQDDAGKPAANEVFRFDFDGPTGNGTFGGGTLGNDRETTLGGGDSGGPSFVLVEGADPALASSYQLIGVNTFTQGSNAPKFGSLGGGINVFPYAAWIQSGGTLSSTGGSGPAGRGAKVADSGLGVAVASLPLVSLDHPPFFASNVWSSRNEDHGASLTTADRTRPETLPEFGPRLETLAPPNFAQAMVSASSMRRLSAAGDLESDTDEWFAELGSDEQPLARL
ncbi:MAG TPA: trypsin-like serine protease [Pirellulaceae bacterium]|nr:trypsin-like serine protease [Pirellulaceae bacterium]